MEYKFKGHFLQSIFPFALLLKTIGIFLDIDESGKKWMCYSWSCFCFFLSLQGGFYTYLSKGHFFFSYAFTESNGNPLTLSKMDSFTKAIEIMNTVTFCSIIYLLLAPTISTTIDLLCVFLQPLNTLKRLDSISLRRYSILAVAWCCITVKST